MKPVFYVNIYRNVFVESHMPGGYLEKASGSEMCFLLEDTIPAWANQYIKFVEYIYDEKNSVVGVKIECDYGGGYYAKDEKQIISAYPGKKYEFDHNWTGVDDDGCPEDNCDDIAFILGWAEETDE